VIGLARRRSCTALEGPRGPDGDLIDQLRQGRHSLQSVPVSGFELTAAIAAALAWPAAAVAVAFLLRQPVMGWLSSDPPSKLKAGPVEVEWSRAQAEVEGEVGPPPADASEGSSAVLSDELRALAESQPALAVLGAYREIEHALLSVLKDVDDPEKARSSGPRLARLALRHGRVTSETANAVEAISVLRNLAAHGGQGEITTERSQEFLSMADAVLFAIRSRR
jgi:hypothetical protein